MAVFVAAPNVSAVFGPEPGSPRGDQLFESPHWPLTAPVQVDWAAAGGARMRAAATAGASSEPGARRGRGARGMVGTGGRGAGEGDRPPERATPWPGRPDE